MSVVWVSVRREGSECGVGECEEKLGVICNTFLGPLTQ